jgi:DHA1 family tetracycline resistance protein-like MFS transporter
LVEPVPNAAPPRAALFVVYVTVFLDLLGFGIILPLLPYYAIKFGASARQLGFVFGAFSAAQFAGAFLLGRLSDRLGRRPVLLTCLAGASLAFLATGMAESLIGLVLARGFAGLFAGSISTAQAYVADVTRPEERARYMGLVGASIGMGFVFGPWVGAELSRFGFRTSAFAAAGLAAANLLIAIVALRESRPRGARAGGRAQLSLRRVGTVLRRPVIGPILIGGCLATLAFVSMESTFALLGRQRFSLNEQQLGRVFALVGITMIVVQGGLVGRLARWLGERRLATVGAVILASALLAMPFMPTLASLIGALLCVSVGQGLFVPSMATLLSRGSGTDEQGAVLGIGQSLASLARAVGPPLAGTLFDQAAARPYLLASTLMVLVAALLLRTRHRAAGTLPGPHR